MKEEKEFNQKVADNANRQDEKPERWVQIRLIPIWLRILLTLSFLVLIGILGLYIGFSVLGDGAPGEIFNKETWTHITDIIQGIE